MQSAKHWLGFLLLTQKINTIVVMPKEHNTPSRCLDMKTLALINVCKQFMIVITHKFGLCKTG